jgi:hypothetical protein
VRRRNGWPKRTHTQSTGSPTGLGDREIVAAEAGSRRKSSDPTDICNMLHMVVTCKRVEFMAQHRPSFGALEQQAPIPFQDDHFEESDAGRLGLACR